MRRRRRGGENFELVLVVPLLPDLVPVRMLPHACMHEHLTTATTAPLARHHFPLSLPPPWCAPAFPADRPWSLEVVTLVTLVDVALAVALAVVLVVVRAAASRFDAHGLHPRIAKCDHGCILG